MLGNETRRKACTFYMVSEHAKIGVRGEEQASGLLDRIWDTL